MAKLSQTEFLKTLPELMVACLPERVQGVWFRHTYRWLTQFYYGEPSFRYEVTSAKHRPGWELGFHCEARDKRLNRFLLDGFRRYLFEIKSELGDGIEAEMWDRGWTKIYEVLPAAELTEVYQETVGERLAKIIICLRPIYVQLHNDVARIHH